jgi:8-oxo-dGTP diphosphatase
MIRLYITKAIIEFNNKYLLLEKIKDDISDNNKGKWEVPGGKIEENETPEQAILREIKEETGLDCQIIKELPLLNMKKENFESKCHVFLIKTTSNKVMLSKEHSNFTWVTSEEVKIMKSVLFPDILLDYLSQADTYFKQIC